MAWCVIRVSFASVFIACAWSSFLLNSCRACDRMTLEQIFVSPISHFFMKFFNNFPIGGWYIPEQVFYGSVYSLCTRMSSILSFLCPDVDVQR